MGADLARGCVKGESIQCPFHEWEFGPDGKCSRIPSTGDIPHFAQQTSYPVQEQGGHLFFFNRPRALFPLPFFEGVTGDDLLPAKPFEILAETAWYMIGANAFDLQHFRSAHDRTLVGKPTVDSPSPFARRIAATFDVSGNSIRDRLTRLFSGPQVRMTVTDWSGNLILVTAQFRRTTSYGMVTTKPISAEKTLLKTIVWVRRSKGMLGRLLLNPVDAFIRRSFIRAFMLSDAERSPGARYNPGALIEADRELADYFDWLKGLAGTSSPREDVAPEASRGQII